MGKPHDPFSYPSDEFMARLTIALQRKVGSQRGWMRLAAERLEVSNVSVWQWTTGICFPSIGRLVAIAEMTGCSIDWLLRGE